MNAKARLLRLENKKGTSSKGKAYDLTFGSFLDLETFDKINCLLPDSDVEKLKGNEGKNFTLTLGVDARSEKPSFLSAVPLA